MHTVILANGRFPTHPVPLEVLKNASRIVCCDGSTSNLLKYGLEPTAIVGDLDSVTDELKVKFKNRLFFNPDQNTNDLTKAIHWCKEGGYKRISILAGTGMRDDHTLGNIGLLPSYIKLGIDVDMVTDYGIFAPIQSGKMINSFKGQQVSIFSFNNSTKLTTHNLKYSIYKKELKELWMGTLNESLGDRFEIVFKPGPIIVFQTHK